MPIINPDGTVNRKPVYAAMHGTYLQQGIVTTYAALVATFGPPDDVDPETGPMVYNGWTIRTPAGIVNLYDWSSAAEEGTYRHDEHPDDVRRYSIGGWRGEAPQTVHAVINAIRQAGHEVREEPS